MSKPRIHLILSLACITAACGSDREQDPGAHAPGSQDSSEQHAGLLPSLAAKAAPKDSGDAPMVISSLVPEGSCAWIRLTSFDELVDLMDEFMRTFPGPDGLDFETALEHLPAGDALKGVLENLDRSRELGFALGFVAGSARPGVTVMLPVLDRGAVIQGLRALPQAPQCFGIDDYVVATNLEEYRPGLGSALLTNELMQGQFTARVDLQTLIKQIGPLLELGLAQLASAPASGIEGARASVLQGLQAAARSAESLNFAIDLDAGEVDLSLALVATSDTKPDASWPRGSGSLYDLARCLEEGDATSVLLTFDSATMQTRLLPLYAQTLEGFVGRGELEATLRDVLLELGALSPLFGDTLVTSISSEGDSPCATIYFRPPERESFMGTLDAVLRSLDRGLPSLEISGPVQGSVDTAYTLSLPGAASTEARAAFSQRFPAGNLTLRIAERREVTAITIGCDEHAMSAALDRIARSADQHPESLAEALGRIGHANPAFLVRIDLARVLHGLDLDDAEPLYLTCYGGVDSRTWRLGLRTDLSRLAHLIKE